LTPIPKPSGSSEFWVKKDLIGKVGVIVTAPDTRTITVGKKTEDQTGFDVSIGTEKRWFNPSNACYGILYDMLKSKGLDVEQESVWISQQVQFSEQMAKVTVKGGSTKIQQVLLAIPVGMTYTPPTMMAPAIAGTTTPTTPPTTTTETPPPADRSVEIYSNAQALVKSGVETDLAKAIALVKTQMGIV